MIVRRFDLTLVAGHAIDIEPGIPSRPKYGVKVTLAPRLPEAEGRQRPNVAASA